MFMSMRPVCAALVLAGAIAGLPRQAVAAVERPTLDIVKMVGIRLPNLFDEDNPGPYNQAYDALTKGFVGRVRLTMTTFARGRDGFYSGQYACSFLSSKRPDRYEANHVDMKDLVFSDPYHVISLKVYSRPGLAPVSSLADLAGKKIVGEMSAADNALSLKVLPEDAQLMAVLSTRKAFMMLESGRADVVISYDIDARRHAQAPGSDSLNTDPDFALVRQEEVVACWRGAETEALIRHINGRIADLKARGELQNFFWDDSQ